MKKKKDKNSNPLISNFISLMFDLLKHFIKDFENIKKVKKIDKFDDKILTLEHLIIKLQGRLQENRMLIEDIKNRVFWGNIVIVLLLLLNLFLIIK